MRKKRKTKHQRKNVRKKPRTEQIFATVKATQDNISFVFDKMHDKLILPDCDVQSINQRTFYNKSSNKEKTLHATPGKGSHGYFNLIH
jgi:hypothetical protein